MKTKRNRALILLFTLNLGITLVGCGTLSRAPKPVIKYAVAYPPSPSVFAEKLPAVLKVDRFGAAPGYASAHMIYAAGPFERNAYAYHQWFAPPAQMATYALVKDLRAGKAFAAITLPGDGIKATHVLTGGITDFYERDDLADGAAVLGISILLYTESTLKQNQQILLEKHYSIEIPCKEKNAPAFAAAMNLAVQSLSDQIIADLVDAIPAQTNHAKPAEKLIE